MDEILEKLWNEYFAGECATIETEKERELAKKVAEKHKTANALLTKEQGCAIEEYVDALYETQSSFVKKAFFKGCEFAASFFLETGGRKKAP